MTTFQPVADALRAAVSETLPDAPEATLDTNSTLIATRAELLTGLLRRWTDLGDLRDARVLDLGAGFGSISLWLAAVEGASVVAVDPNGPRLAAGEAVAAEHGLPVEFVRAQMQYAQRIIDGPFDVVVLNNSLCYLLEPEARTKALAFAHAALRPGGWVVKRDPNRWHPFDPFSNLPLVHMLGPEASFTAAQRLGRRRSRTRLTSARAAVAELRDAGFERAFAVRRPGRANERSSSVTLERYHHTLARRAGDAGRP